MENKKVYFKMTEVRKYEKETGKFTGKAQIYLENGNAMEPHYITTGTGRKIEEIVNISGSFPYKLNRFDFYVGLVKSQEEDNIVLSRIDRIAPDTEDVLRVFLQRFIKKVRVRKKVLKDFQTGGFKTFRSFLPNLASAGVDVKAIQDIRTNLTEHEQCTHLQDLLEEVDCSYNSVSELIIKYKDEAENILKTTPFTAFSE